MKKSPDLSLVITCYNEEGILEESVTEIEQVLKIAKLTYELIFIDDKSKDSTRDVINKIVKKKSNYRAFFHKVNKGRGGAVTTGFNKAKGKVVGFIDIDLEVSPVHIPLFAKKILDGEADVVTGHRVYRETLTSLHRAVLSRGYSLLVKKVLGITLLDTETGYKFFDRKKILPILNKTKNTRWFWDTEIMTYAYYDGLEISEMPVAFVRRLDIPSSVNVIRDTLDYFASLYNFQRKLKRKYGNKLMKKSNNKQENYRTDFYKFLYDIEPKHFWFKGRKMIIESIISRFNKKRGGSFLEVGCGTGLILKLLDKLGFSVVGLDMHEEGLMFARKRVDVPLVHSKLGKIRLKKKFDFVGVFDVIEHVPKQKIFLKKCKKLVKNGGYIIMTVPAREELWSKIDELSGHKRRYDKESLRRLVLSSGLKIEMLEYFNFFLYPIQWIVRKIQNKNVKLSEAKTNIFIKNSLRCPPLLINKFASLLFYIESKVIGKISFPIGGSLIVVAKKSQK